MARIALGVLSVVLILTAPGCTWTRTYQDFPPGVSSDQAHPHHHHHEGPVEAGS
jgi:hypothetical protein